MDEKVLHETIEQTRERESLLLTYLTVPSYRTYLYNLSFCLGNINRFPQLFNDFFHCWSFPWIFLDSFSLHLIYNHKLFILVGLQFWINQATEILPIIKALLHLNKVENKVLSLNHVANIVQPHEQNKDTNKYKNSNDDITKEGSLFVLFYFANKIDTTMHEIHQKVQLVRLPCGF